MKERDELEDLFSSAFSDFEKMPPPDLKSAIDGRLFTVPEKKKKRGYIWIISAVALLMGAFWIGYASLDGSNKSEQQVSASSAVSNSGTAENAQWKNESGLKKYKNLKETSNANKGNMRSGEASKKGTKAIEDKGFVEINSHSTTVNKPVQTEHPTNKGGLHKSINSKKRVKKPSVEAELPQIIAEDPLYSQGINEITKLSNDVSDELVKKENKQTEIAQNTDETKSVSTSADSAQTQSHSPVQPTAELPSASLKASKNWSMSLLTGPTYGLSKLNRPTSPEYYMKEKPGFAVGLESTIMLRQSWGFTTGFDMNKRTDIFYKEVMDSTLIGETYSYIYDPQVTDSIIDSVMVDVYEYSGTTSERQQQISHFSLAVPVLFTVAFPLSQTLDLELNGGLRFAFVANKTVSNPNEYSLPDPSFKSFAIRATLRPQIIYSMDNGMGIGGYLNTGYDLIPAVQWDSIKRSRLDLGGGILLRYSF